MTSSIGSASVRIEPDLTGFNRTVQLAIDQGDFDIDATLDQASLATSLEVAEEALGDLDLNADLDAAQIAAQVEAIQATLPDLDLDADVNEQGLRARLATLIQGLQATLPEIDLRVGLGRATAAIASFEALTAGAARRASRLGLIAGAGTAAAAGAATGIALLNLAQFDEKLTSSLAIVSDVTPEIRKQFEEVAFDVARSTRFGADEAAEAYFFLASAGLDAEQQLAALPVVAQGAQAGMFDLATATDLFTDASSAVGLAVTDAASGIENLTRTQDVFVKANLLANATVEQFSESITNKAGSQLRVLNKDLEEGVAVLAAFADQGVKGRLSGEKLNIILRDLSSQAVASKDEFAALGISVFDADGQFRNIADVIEDFEDALGPMSAEARAAALAQTGLGREAADAVFQLLGSSDAIRQYEMNLRSAGGTSEQVAKAQLGSLPAVLDLIKNRVEVAGLALAGPLRDSLITLTTTNSEAFNAFFASVESRAAAFGAKIPGLLASVVGFFQSESFAMFADQIGSAFGIIGDAFEGFVRSFAVATGDTEAASGTFLNAFGSAIVGVAGIVRDIAPIIGSIMGRLASLLEGNSSAVGTFAKLWIGAFVAIKALKIVAFLVKPFLLLLKPLGSAILQIAKLRKTVAAGGELTKFQGVLVRIGSWLSRLLPLVPLLGSAIAGLSLPVTAAVVAVAALTAGIVLLWQNSETFRAIIGGVGEVLSQVGSAAMPLFSAAVEALGPIVAMVGSSIARVFRRIGRVFQNVVDLVVALVQGDFRAVGREMVEIVTSAVQLIVELFFSLPRKIGEAIGELVLVVLDLNRRMFTELLNLIGRNARAIVGWFVRISNRILEALAGLPGALVDIGVEIMLGLLDGLKDGWEDVKEFLGGIAGRIKQLKGPIEVDRELLVPEGMAIMDGFGRGLRQAWDGVAGWIGGRGGFIKGLFGANDVATLNDITIDTLLGNITNPGSRLDDLIPNLPRYWTSFADMMQQAQEMARMFNVGISSTLRSMAENTAVGGAANSWHLFGRAVDFAGATGNLDSLASFAREMERFFVEILWRVQGHFDHVHLAWATLPRRQHGGSVMGGEPHLVGEAGAEIFFPERSGFVASNADLKNLIELMRGGNLAAAGPQVLVQPVNADPVAVGRIVAAHLSMPARRLPGRR